MDFALTNEQEMLKRSARDFLAAECKFETGRAMEADRQGCPPDFWQKIVDLGWTALPFPEQYGGAGGSIVDLAVLSEEMGRANMPGPFFSSVILGGLTILEAGDDQQRADLLPSIVEGETIATLAVLEPELSYEPRDLRTMAYPNESGYVISGTKLFVPNAHLADYVLCAARVADPRQGDEAVSLFRVVRSEGRAEGMSLTALDTMAGDKLFEVVLTSTPVARNSLIGKPNEAWPALRKVLQIAAVAKCAELLGGAQKVIELAVEHGRNRSQFGSLIGSFQAVQHHCANMVIDVDLGRFLTYQAAWLLSEGKECAKQVSMAKTFVGDAYLRVCMLGHEVLGGNGLIDEHEMPLFSKRAYSGQQAFGSSDRHRELVAQALGL